VDEFVHQQVTVGSLVDDSQKTYLQNDPAFKRLYGFTPDGRGLIYGRLDSATKWDVWLLMLDGSAPPRPLLHAGGNELGASLSPDGRLLAYTSDESGISEVYVVPFGAPGMRYQVTSGGGLFSVWSHDSTRLFLALAKEPNTIMQAGVLPGRVFALGDTKRMGRVPDDSQGLDLTADASRIIACMPAEKARPQTVTVVQNWPAALKRP
jgi:hypothetical protein